MPTKVRRSLATEDRDLARRIGGRLKAARLRAGLTQREVAGERYTKAYVSALENGLIKPSVAALNYLAARLGTTPSHLLEEPEPRWTRLEAELRLASAEWQTAADAFDALLEEEQAAPVRGELLLGLAEARYRLGRSADAIRVASEARDLLARAGRLDLARMATYWLAAAHHQSDNPAQARLLLEELLADDRPTAPLDPDLHVRGLIALAMVLTNAGEPKRALLTLEEARGLTADLDDRRRATLLFSLALGYRASGDTEAAIRTGLQGLSLYRAANAASESASVENELALTYLRLGNTTEAARYAALAREHFETLGDAFWLAQVAETEAQIALARGETGDAVARARAAASLARSAKNPAAELAALLTEARGQRRQGESAQAIEALAAAADVARSGPPARLREVLTEWSELLAESGDHEGAYALTREALRLG